MEPGCLFFESRFSAYFFICFWHHLGRILITFGLQKVLAPQFYSTLFGVRFGVLFVLRFFGAKGHQNWSKWSQKVPKSGPNGAKRGQSVAKSAPAKRQTEPRTPNIPKPPASQIESLRDGRERAERQGAAVFPRRGGQFLTIDDHNRSLIKGHILTWL